MWKIAKNNRVSAKSRRVGFPEFQKAFWEGVVAAVRIDAGPVLQNKSGWMEGFHWKQANPDWVFSQDGIYAVNKAATEAWKCL